MSLVETVQYNDKKRSANLKFLRKKKKKKKDSALVDEKIIVRYSLIKLCGKHRTE